ncbi:MAG TPA: HNH endonuclease, partial [Micrococcaceae bacterium]
MDTNKEPELARGASQEQPGTAVGLVVSAARASLGDPDAAAVTRFVASLALMDRGVDDAGRIDQIRVLEDLKAAASAAQARVTADFNASQRLAQAAAGLPVKELGKGIGAQIALARRESPTQGG